MMSISNKGNIRRAMTPNPKQRINFKTLKSQIKSKKNKIKVKIFSKYPNSNSHLNELIAKMRYFKTLLYKTSDLKSLLLLDTYGLRYSNELKKIVNKVKNNIFPIPHHYNFSMKNEESTKKIQRSIIKEKKINFSFNTNCTNKHTKKEENKVDNEFDLTHDIKSKNDKLLNKHFLINVKKNKKLLNLKAQIFLLEKNRYILSKKNKNIEFFRVNDTKKNNVYNKIKSKYRRPKTAVTHLKSNKSISKIKINFKEDDSKTDIFFNEPSENITAIKSSFTPNISLYKSSRIKTPKMSIKQKYKQNIFPKDISENQIKTSIKSNFNYSQNFNHSMLLKQKKYFIDKLNNIETKSHFINQDFSYFSNESQDVGSKLFNKSFKKNVNQNNNEIVNLKKINDYFNFSKGFENNIESLLKKNANKVKKIMDPKCGKILDKVIKEIWLEENKLNKNYFLSFKEDKPENKNDIMNKYKEMFKGEGNDDIFDVFKNKEDDFINEVRTNKIDVNDIEQQYIKTKIIKKCDNLKAN